MILIAIQNKFTLTKFSLHIKFHKELIVMFLRESVVLKSYVRRLCIYNGFPPNI